MMEEVLYKALIEGGDRVVAIGCQPTEVDERLLCGGMLSVCRLHIDCPMGSGILGGDDPVNIPNAAVEDFDRIR